MRYPPTLKEAVAVPRECGFETTKNKFS
jgi:hypothetical protein